MLRWILKDLTINWKCWNKVTLMWNWDLKDELETSNSSNFVNDKLFLRKTWVKNYGFEKCDGNCFLRNDINGEND